MKRPTLTLLFALLLSLAATPPGSAQPPPGTTACLDDVKDIETSFFISSRRNATAHRVIKTFLVNRGVTDGVADMNVLQSKKVEGGNVILRLQAEVVVSETPFGRGSAETRTQYIPAPALGSAYRLHLTPRSWAVARAVCEAEGAYLAVPNSAEEARHLAALLSTAPSPIPGADYSHVASIGFTDLAADGTHRTIFGDTLEQAGYSEWGSGQPNNAVSSKGDKRSDCGGIERTGGLNDLPCNTLTAFICESPIWL